MIAKRTAFALSDRPCTVGSCPMSGIQSHPNREQMCVPLIQCIASLAAEKKLPYLMRWCPRH